jgi:hypothetical protein
VVNDSGVYLPVRFPETNTTMHDKRVAWLTATHEQPSPTEEKGQWPRRYLSRNSTDTRSSFGDIEHFSISRESFDSYRRSFDVSARSPVINADGPGRGSLDSARFPRLPKSAMEIKERQLPTAEEAFEDVGLDDHNKQLPALPQQQRKRGFFAKFSDSQEKDTLGQQSVSRFLIPSRKRGQSGQGAELGQMDQPKVMVTADGQDGH